jgi:hypothetical protein
MSMSVRIPGCLAVAVFCGLPLTVGAQKPAAEDVLAAAGKYLLEYSQQLSTVAAEEEYTQREPSSGSVSRRLYSDVVLVGLDDGMVAGFRDVFAIDGRDVRPRDERLLKLFQSPPSEASQAQAMAWADEGLRYYLSPNLRTLDFPTIALELLRPKHHAQSEFTLDGVRNQDGARVATLKFKVRPSGSVLPTPEGSTTSGRAWVDADAGTIRQTELIVEGKGYSYRTTTKYALESAQALWLPADVVTLVDVSSAAGGLSNMGGGGNMGARQSLEGRARYTKFRKVAR